MKKIGWVLLAAAVCLAAALLVLDVRFMNSQSNTQSAIASSGTEGFRKQSSFTPGATAMYVAGDGPVSATLRDQLRAMLQGQVYTGEISLLNLPADRLDLPVLYVEVIPVTYSWTPIHANSEFQLVVSYATNGDVSFRNAPVARFQSQPGPAALQFSAKITIRDDSWGVISSPGYSNFLSSQFALAIRDTLEKQITG